MGSPYGHQYHLAGSGTRCGTMVCAGCGKPIDGKAQSWREYKRSKNYDWAYVTHHRDCCANDPAWQKLDLRLAQAGERRTALLSAAEAFRALWKIDDLDDLIGGLREAQADADGDDDEPRTREEWQRQLDEDDMGGGAYG